MLLNSGPSRGEGWPALGVGPQRKVIKVGGHTAASTTGARHAKDWKEIRRGSATGRRQTALDRNGRAAHAESEIREVRRDGRDRDAPGRRSEARRSDGAWNGGPAARVGQDEARPGDCGRGETKGCAAGGGGLRRRRGAGRKDSGRLDRLRCGC